MQAENRVCQNCKNQFTIEPDDFAFYEKIKVPAPTWCPECRLMRRLTWRNERALYKRTCDMCKTSIIAMYPADASFPVYCKDCWYSDKWDATTYGRDYDFTRPFFEQFHELIQVVPQIALQVSTSPGSDYVNQVANCKDCYLIASGSDNEECLYCYRVLNSRGAVDSSFVEKIQSSYECVQCIESSNLRFAEDCINSSHLTFCTDVHGSQNCFMSSNIRLGANVFRNEKISREDFAEKMKSIDMGSHSAIQSYQKEFSELKRSRLHKYMTEKNAPGCTGDAVANSKNAKHCFVSGDLENCSYLLMVAKAKDSADVNNGCCTMELAYECSTAGVNTYNTKLSADVWPDVRNATYSQSCRNDVNNLFGCVSVRKKQHCIFNKQYTKEEYEALVPKIIAQMNEMPYTDKKGRVYKYGEFFPPEFSIYAYNETPAQDYFPKTEDETETMGFRWKTIEPRHYGITIASNYLPDHIRDVADDITKQIVGCEHEGKCNHQCTAAFRITPNELLFYRRMNLPLPHLCPNCRHYERFTMTNPYRLWKRHCQCAGAESESGAYKNTIAHFHGTGKCPSEFETSYAPERKEIVYCEQCYNSEVV